MSFTNQILITYFMAKNEVCVKVSGFPANVEFSNGMRSIESATWNKYDNSWYSKAEYGTEIENLVKECFSQSPLVILGRDLKKQITDKQTVPYKLTDCDLSDSQTTWLIETFKDIGDTCRNKIIYRLGGQGKPPNGEHKVFFCKKELFRIAKRLLAVNGIDKSIRSIDLTKGYKPLVETFNALTSYIFFALSKEDEEDVFTMMIFYQDFKPRKYRMKIYV